MGAFSDNFYSWMDRQNAAEKAAMDESVGYKHPDGTPCKAKKQENCPFYKKDMKESVEIDDLKTPSEVSKVETVATPEEMEAIKRGGNPNEGKFEAVSPSDLTTMQVGSTNSKYRNMRNKLVDWVVRNKKDAGTYPLVDVDNEDEIEDLEPVYYDDGYMVSFQTTNGEGFNSSRVDLTMSDEDYDMLVDDLISELGGKPHVGVFGGIPEISFKVDSKEMAENLARKYNQVSIWDNAQGARAAKAEEEGVLSAAKIKRLWARASKFNKDYKWKTNQVTKKK